MVKQEMTLKELQRAVAREKTKAKTAEQRRALEKELKMFRSGDRTKLLRRLGRGFLVLTKEGAKAAGKGIVKARDFAEKSGAGEGVKDLRLASALPSKSGRTTRVRRVRGRPRTVVVTRKVRTTTRRVARPRRRKVIRVVRRAPKRRRTRSVSDNGGGFFGGLETGGF